MYTFMRFSIYLFLIFTIFSCQKEPLNTSKDYRTLGLSANDLLTATNYPNLSIQISYMPGYAPDEVMLSNLKIFISTYTHKTNINIVTQPVPPSGKSKLSLDEIVKLEKSYRTVSTDGNTITVHILITDTDYTDEENFALSYWNTSFTLFGRNIYRHSGGAGQVSRVNLISTLLQHEFGHLLGLVGQGTSMVLPHRDEPNGAHCINANCLMYYGIETSETINPNIIPSLDNHCRNDLKANGGK